MDAIITAGGIPKPEDPLYKYTQGKPKALLEIAGKTMVQWVLDAVCASEKVEHIVIVGLEDGDVSPTGQKPIAFMPDQGSLFQNVRGSIAKAVELNPNAEHVLMVSSDIPTITTEMVDWAIDAALETEHDVYYNVVTRETMEARFPGSNRSFIKFKDVEICGADMNIARVEAAHGNDELWQKLIGARKNALKQAALFGFDTLLLMLLRRLTINDAVERVGKRLHLRGRAIISPYAEIAMDVDKPHQFELLRADMEKRYAA